MHKRSRHMPKETDLPDDRIPARSSEGVVITMYVESSSSLSNRPGSQGNAGRRRNGPSRAHECFDRRAQLLAYSRDLRRGDAASGEWRRSYANGCPKGKKRRPRWFIARKKFRLWFDRMCSFRTWPITKHGYKRVDQPTDDVKSCGGNRKGFPFPSKLKFQFREMWWGCSRSSGR